MDVILDAAVCTRNDCFKCMTVMVATLYILLYC